jgi:uncharacterized protein
LRILPWDASMPEDLLVFVAFAAATCLATAMQTLAGFGFALIVMPIATMLLGVRTAAPLVALTALTLYAVNTIRYRESLNTNEVWRLAIAAAAGVPIGVWGAASASESLVKPLLGMLLIGYGLYGLAFPSPQRRCSSRWAYVAGFLSGSLGGAYNTSGPPLAVYGAARQWPKNEFRAGLQTLFFVSGALTVFWHAVARHISLAVLGLYAWAACALIVGLVVGVRVDRYVNKERFRLVVVIMILLLGLSLLLNVGR